MIPDKHDITNESLKHEGLTHGPGDNGNRVFVGVKKTNLNLRFDKEFYGNGNCKGWTIHCFNSKQVSHIKLNEGVKDIATISYLFSFLARRDIFKNQL